MSSHLVLPDPHSHPDFSNARFNWAGKLVADLHPDHVICIGDFSDMPSLSSYDKGTRGFEGRRYHRDVASTIEAQELFFKPIRARKKRLPKFWMLEGNHEHRISRAIDKDPAQLEDIISLADLQYKEFGWEIVPYHGATPGILELDGIAYAHYFTSGVQGRPIGGTHPAYQLLHKQLMSCTQGHTHTTDYSVHTNAMGKYLHGLISGCYIDWFADFAGETNNMWWKGIIYKEDVNDGSYNPRWIGLQSISRAYADN